MRFEIALPFELVNETNAREHWGSRQKRAKRQRHRTLLDMANATLKLGRPKLPVVVTITRIGPRKLDSDNLAASGKHVRDGVADALGVDDGDESKVTWQYRQEIGRYGTRVLVEDSEASGLDLRDCPGGGSIQNREHSAPAKKGRL